MTKQIEADTLRAWLEAQQPVTVLDIRTDDDRARRAIPGDRPMAAVRFAARLEAGPRLQACARQRGRISLAVVPAAR